MATSSSTSDGFGLNKDARNAAAAAAKQLANQAPPLDPPFPYDDFFMAFDPVMFGLTTDPNRAPKNN